jgi:hypothetical protein
VASQLGNAYDSDDTLSNDESSSVASKLGNAYNSDDNFPNDDHDSDDNSSCRSSESLPVDNYIYHPFPRNAKGLTLCSHNVNHISNKIDELKLCLECDNDNVKPDVYGICETFLSTDMHDDEVQIKGYNMIRKDRKYSTGGGLIIYMKDWLDFELREDLECKNDSKFEIIWVELLFANKSLLLALIYRPPRADNVVKWLELWKNLLNVHTLKTKT